MKIRIALLVAGCAMILCLPFVVSSKDNPAQAKAREAARAAAWPPPAEVEKPAEPAAPATASKPAESKSAFAVTAGAEDTEAQAKARQALREDKVAPASPAAAAATAQAPASPAPTASSAGPSPQPLASGPRPDTEAQALARAALREKTLVVEVVATEAAPPAAGSTPTVAGGPRADTEAQAKARELVREQSATAVAAVEPAPVAVAAVPQPRPVKQQPAAKRPTKGNPLFEGLEMPEPAFTPEQEAALAELLDPYNADQISTEEYHQKRSAIIAGT